jgi:hypothetical protein
MERERLELASPVTGRGVVVGRMDAVLLSAIEQPSPELWIQQRLHKSGISLKPTGGQAIDSPAEQLAAIGRILEVFRSSRLPKFASLGLVT